MIKHELDSDGQYKEALLDLIAQPLRLQESGFVFLGGDDNLGRRQVLESIIDALNVLRAEIVMVAEGQWRDLLGERLQVIEHLLWRCNTRQQ